MKPPKVPTFVSLLILTTITIVVWIFFDVVRALTTKSAGGVPTEILEPISPNIDQGSLDKIEKGGFFEEGQIQEATPTASPTASPSASPRKAI